MSDDEDQVITGPVEEHEMWSDKTDDRIALYLVVLLSVLTVFFFIVVPLVMFVVDPIFSTLYETRGGTLQ